MNPRSLVTVSSPKKRPLQLHHNMFTSPKKIQKVFNFNEEYYIKITKREETPVEEFYDSGSALPPDTTEASLEIMSDNDDEPTVNLYVVEVLICVFR